MSRLLLFKSTSTAISLVALTLAGALVAGCSAHISSDAAPAPAAPAPATDKVTAIKLDGVWASDCSMNPYGQGGVKVTMTIKDHDFSRATTYYSDYDCKTTATDSDQISGTFTFQKAKASNVYEVEYLVKAGVPARNPYRMASNVKRVDDSLWISLLANEDYPPTTELKLVK